MTYNPNIPSTGMSLGTSRPLVQGNFYLLQQLIDINHVDFALPGMGKHTFVQMINQGSAPTTGANETAIYTRTDNETTPSQRTVLRKANNGLELLISGLNPVVASNGATNLTGRLDQNGLMIQWGSNTVTGTINQGYNTPFFLADGVTAVAAYFVMAAVTDLTGPINQGVTFINSTGFGFQATGTHRFNWVAIGPRP